MRIWRTVCGAKGWPLPGHILGRCPPYNTKSCIRKRRRPTYKRAEYVRLGDPKSLPHSRADVSPGCRSAAEGDSVSQPLCVTRDLWQTDAHVEPAGLSRFVHGKSDALSARGASRQGYWHHV